MSVEKRQGKYIVRWRDTAGKQRSKTVALWRDAVVLDSEMKRKKAMGELIAHERGTIRLCDFWTVWLERYGSVHVTPRTLDIYRRLWRRHVAPTIGPRRLRDLSREDIDGLTQRLTARLSSSSTRKVLAILQGVLQRAVEWQYIAVNPALGARKPRLVTRRGRALTVGQLAALDTELPDLRSRCVVRVLAYSGVRPGEMRALTHDCVTQDSVIVGAAVSHNEIGPTKTNRSRRVPMNPALHRALTEWHLSQGAGSVLVFPAVNGRGVWTDTAWNLWAKRVFAPAAARAGLKGLVPYDLRHTYVTTLIQDGVNPIDVARWSGHSLAVCLSTYAHEFEAARDATAPLGARSPLTLRS